MSNSAAVIINPVHILSGHSYGLSPRTWLYFGSSSRGYEAESFWKASGVEANERKNMGVIQLLPYDSFTTKFLTCSWVRPRRPYWSVISTAPLIISFSPQPLLKKSEGPSNIRPSRSMFLSKYPTTRTNVQSVLTLNENYLPLLLLHQWDLHFLS